MSVWVEVPVLVITDGSAPISVMARVSVANVQAAVQKRGLSTDVDSYRAALQRIVRDSPDNEAMSRAIARQALAARPAATKEAA